MDEARWRPLYEARRPHVFLLWHEVLLPLLWQHRRQSIVIVVSEARDGQYLADFAASLGYRAVRGSSTRGGARALLGAVRDLQAGSAVAFTPDGPRGPRRELKPGVVAAAQRGGGTIVPLHAEADRAWRLDSWDRLVIPKPGARVRIVYGRPFEVAPGAEGLAAGLVDAEARLREIAGDD
ncbi:MAG: lysophospholipid acyltransferase family protein [Gemmatimonadales bacterium]